MATNVPIPNLGDSISQATVLRWIKNDGDYVQVDEPLLELETDKANTDLPAPVAGVLRQAKKVGDVVKIGEVVATVDENAKAPTATPVPTAAASATPPPVAPKPSPEPPATTSANPSARPAPPEFLDLNPSVRALIVERNLNPRDIPGTGPHGRLLKEDVLAYLESSNGKSSSATVTTAPPPTPVKPAPTPDTKSAKPGARQYDANGISREPISKIRDATARNLKEAQNTAAILTTFNEVDMSGIMDLRAKHKERFEKTYGVGLGFMSFFARAVILALREFPRVNAFIDGKEVVYHNYVNLGVAVSSEKGLLVPVLKHAEQMSFAKIESEIKRVAGAVREGKLALSELSGGTFTITNGGVFGSLMSTPILLPPQSGILGMHAINKRPIAVGDEIKIRPMMYIALSYDHRLVDGRDSVSFLVRLKEYLEDPARLMLEI
ncbi:MAG TPA: 2-oxoglutarate dehydrogenase complex dihydrolipoyllysine-residue succinyltransferase [Tepidisphaeraceae bacterium]|jgi:2-oxoglutarate dehydrogenase E2 component (dihydrolipoamide succinyltransferase)|nr:2-oxoglutarate dehydrogenase complex dihydrolipoyllysine-residue succinyltransferase [Tepidisphaeraceae bacterium]